MRLSLRLRDALRARLRPSSAIFFVALFAPALIALACFADARTSSFVTLGVLATGGGTFAAVRRRHSASAESARATRDDMSTFVCRAQRAMGSSSGRLLLVRIDEPTDAVAVSALTSAPSDSETRRSVAGVLGRLGGGGHVIGDFGDGVLAVILVGATENEAIYAAERLHRAVYALSAGVGRSAPRTVSVGIASIHREQFDEGMQAARSALASAECKGRGRTSSAPDSRRHSYVRALKPGVSELRRAR